MFRLVALPFLSFTHWGSWSSFELSLLKIQYAVSLFIACHCFLFSPSLTIDCKGFSFLVFLLHDKTKQLLLLFSLFLHCTVVQLYTRQKEKIFAFPRIDSVLYICTIKYFKPYTHVIVIGLPLVLYKYSTYCTVSSVQYNVYVQGIDK